MPLPARVLDANQRNPNLKFDVEPPSAPVNLIVIGSSTGGLRSIGRLLDSLPDAGPPIVIVQHIKPGYLARTATRFNTYYKWNVDLAQDGQPISRNQIKFAPDGHHLRISESNGLPVAHLVPPAPTDHFVPAANHLFDSVADAFGARAVGVILTGMGKDGADGLLRMRQSGARCVGENEQSCTVYGMPKAAFDAGAVDLELPAEDIGRYLGELIRLGDPARTRLRAAV